MLNLGEIIVVDSVGFFLMVFLRFTMIDNKNSKKINSKCFNYMMLVTAITCLTEMVSCILEGKTFIGQIALEYFLNSAEYFSGVVLGYLWCLYVDYRMFTSRKKVNLLKRILAIPLGIATLIVIINLIKPGIIFEITSDGYYVRGAYSWTLYLILLFYVAFSLCIVYKAKKVGVINRFFPILYFVVPSLLGIIVQNIFFGLCTGWASVAVSLIFVYLHKLYSIAYMDDMSGLYNRKYLKYLLTKMRNDKNISFYGVMLDINDFKQINDTLGHSTGDDAISDAGRLISDSIPNNGMALRIGGDEFLVLLKTNDERDKDEFINTFLTNIAAFNDLKEKPYTLSFAIGISRFDDCNRDVKKFIKEIDDKMYDNKKMSKDISNININNINIIEE